VAGETRPLEQGTSVRKGMAASRSVDVKANHLAADRTLDPQRVKSPPTKELKELKNPELQVRHVRFRAAECC
jgi:hypothetical protein